MRKNKSAALRKPDILESYYQVLIQEGLEGTSISKIANRIGIHPSLIIHYFKNKDNMKLELVDLLIEKYQSPAMINSDWLSPSRSCQMAVVIIPHCWRSGAISVVTSTNCPLSLRNKKPSTGMPYRKGTRRVPTKRSRSPSLSISVAATHELLCGLRNGKATFS